MDADNIAPAETFMLIPTVADLNDSALPAHKRGKEFVLLQARYSKKIT